MTDPIVYLNGELTPLSEARIPVLDRGFIFGDGVYEVVPVYAGKLFRAREHLARLQRSLDGIAISNPFDEAGWRDRLAQVMAANGLSDQMVYIQVTRGVAKRTHAFPAEVIPTVLIMTSPMSRPATRLVEEGVACVTMEDQRWLRCQIKSTSLLGNVLAAQFAAENDATEAIQFRDGLLTEASASNVWVVMQGRLYAPPADNLILEGIRYGVIEDLCRDGGIEFEARRITRDEVFAADEVMLSSASKEILPVVRLDDRVIGTGVPGPVFRRIYAAYQTATQQG